MAWLRLTLQDGRTCLVNTDQVSEVYGSVSGQNTGVRNHEGVSIVRESVDEIAAMIERAEWQKRVERFAAAVIADGLLSHKSVWEYANELAGDMPDIQRSENAHG